MDNLNTNTPIGDTQNSTTTQNTNGLNSMQPVTDLVNDLAGMPDVKDDNKPVEIFPNQSNSTPIPEETIAPVDSPAPVQDLGVFNSPQSPVVETPVSMPTEMPMPTMETPVSMPTEVSMPTMETPVTMPTEIPMPTMETPVNMPTEMPMPTMETPVSMPTEIPMPTMETPVTTPTEMPMPAMETPVSMPTEMPLPNQDLSQPLQQFSTPQETPMPAFKDTEVVNTLTDQKDDKGKGGTAVVIVLIVVIVALLVTIGYFAYRIFFA